MVNEGDGVMGLRSRCGERTVVVTTMKGQTGWGRPVKRWDAAAATRVVMVVRSRSWEMLVYRRVKSKAWGGRKGRGSSWALKV